MAFPSISASERKLVGGDALAPRLAARRPKVCASFSSSATSKVLPFRLTKGQRRSQARGVVSSARGFPGCSCSWGITSQFGGRGICEKRDLAAAWTALPHSDNHAGPSSKQRHALRKKACHTLIGGACHRYPDPQISFKPCRVKTEDTRLGSTLVL